MKKTVAVIMYEGFQTQDAMGPIEVLGDLVDLVEIRCVSLKGGLLKTYQGVPVMTEPMDQVPNPDIVVIPGGRATFEVMNDPEFIGKVRSYVESAEYCLTVCTGSLIVAAAGLLDGRPATTNKSVYEMVTPNFPKVEWKRKARWVKSGKFYTSSGVTAGIDMAFDFVKDIFGEEAAQASSYEMEYQIMSDPDNDPFFDCPQLQL
ncbi:MAG: DJ-1/PfpI family protein [Oscillospiraceae bacterium]|nr:DJ-1/PfpI family protein [Oscillospiraceae bacterium]